MQLHETWQATLGELEVVLSKASFTTWFKGTDLLSIDGDTAIVGVPNIFTKEWFEKKYHADIIKTIKKLTNGQVTHIQYQIGGQTKETKAATKATKKMPAEPTTTPTLMEQDVNSGLKLRPNHTFDSFVVGATNRLAYAVSQAVAKNPGKSHNPLVIYGGVGLGKTHLVQAIGNEIRKEHPHLKIMYTSCEDFANDYIQSIQGKKAESFKKKYRSIDVFLVDDIQFLSRKEGTQEEFFYTFNALHQNDRQIVMTSDRIPTAIPDLEDRLSSRFSQGLVADIQPPNLETRQAIVREKAAVANLSIDPQVLDLIATNVQSNIRELEGALNRVIAFADLQNQPITVELARQALKEMVSSPENKKITPDRLIDTIARYFQITKEELIGPKRNKELVHPRRIVMFLLRNELNLSYPKVGQAMNGKDHTTVMHGVSVLERELTRNDKLQDELSLIKKAIYAD
jgi:chromosomal replication initiator protein